MRPRPSRCTRFRRSAPLAAVLALACPMAWAQEAAYAFDPVHTRVLFGVSHAGFSQALGTVSGTTGTLAFDPGDLAGARVQARVPLTRLDLGDARWNAAALAGNLLDAARFPVAEFTSTRVEPQDARHACVIGQLTLHGVTREVALAVTFNQLRRHPLPPFRRTAGFSATTRLRRSDFGITAWPTVIGDEVTLRMEVEAVRTRNGLPAAGEEADAGDDAAADDSVAGVAAAEPAGPACTALPAPAPTAPTGVPG